MATKKLTTCTTEQMLEEFKRKVSEIGVPTVKSVRITPDCECFYASHNKPGIIGVHYLIEDFMPKDNPINKNILVSVIRSGTKPVHIDMSDSRLTLQRYGCLRAKARFVISQDNSTDLLFSDWSEFYYPFRDMMASWLFDSDKITLEDVIDIYGRKE